MKTLVCLLLISLPAYSQITIYAGPYGSAGGSGTYASQYDLATGLSHINAAAAGSILYLEDSVMTVANMPTVTTIGNGTNRVTIMADTARHALPLITSINQLPPRINFAANTTIFGIGFGGIKDTNISGAVIIGLSGDSLVNCYFWGYSNDCFDISNATGKVVAKNNLIANCGYGSGGSFLQHGFYWTAKPGTADSANTARRNVFVSVGGQKDSVGYALHFWHGPNYSRAIKNFLAYGASYACGGGDATEKGHNYIFRDNIMWSNYYQTITMGLGAPDTTATSAHPDTVLFHHNLEARYVKYWQWAPGRGCYADSNLYEINRNPPGYDGDEPGSVGTWQYSQAANYVGLDSATVDSAIARLSRSFGKTTIATNVHNDTTIISNWTRLVSTVDYWQGTPEGSIYWGTASGGGSPAPSGTFTASVNPVPFGGGSTTLSWTSSDAASASIDQGIGSVALSGSQSVTVTSGTTYTLTLTGVGGTTMYSVTVTVSIVRPQGGYIFRPWK